MVVSTISKSLLRYVFGLVVVETAHRPIIFIFSNFFKHEITFPSVSRGWDGKYSDRRRNSRAQLRRGSWLFRLLAVSRMRIENFDTLCTPAHCNSALSTVLLRRIDIPPFYTHTFTGYCMHGRWRRLGLCECFILRNVNGKHQCDYYYWWLWYWEEWNLVSIALFYFCKGASDWTHDNIGKLSCISD